VKAGMIVVTPSPADIAEKRKLLMGIQDNLVKQMKIDQDAVDTAKAALVAAKVEF
jgi:hypothetical protein